VPDGPRTRFAPAPTGSLHLGHVANAIAVWGVARAEGGSVLLRIEDHDAVRSRPEFDATILEDLAWLGFVSDAGPVRQRAFDAPYADATERLRAAGLVYRCACSRATFAAWRQEHGRVWAGPGCPGGCREREVDGPTWRVALGEGEEAWIDRFGGPLHGPVAAAGDPPIRDRDGHRTYLLCVVVDDLRQGIDLVIRGEDLRGSTPDQIRLGRLLGRTRPAIFAHHPLIRRPDGRKLSKSAGDTGVRELRAAGHRPDEVIGMAAAAIGWLDHPVAVAADEVASLVPPAEA